jgi:hypothetical protein
MDAVFDGVTVMEIGNPNFSACLSNALNAAFTLLKSCWVPGKVNIEERAEALEKAIGGDRGRTAAQMFRAGFLSGPLAD